MRLSIFRFMLLLGVLILSISSAAQRVVLCEEFYQET